MLIRWDDEGLWPQVAAMAGAAGDGHIGIGNFGHVVHVDVLGHGVHQARGGLLRLGVVGIVEPWASVGADVVGVGGVAGTAMRTERALPLFHDLVNLISGQILGQDFEIGGRGMGVIVLLSGGRVTGCGRRGLRGLGNRGGGKESRGQQCCCGGWKGQGR